MYCVPGLKKNLLSISALDAKGMRVAFVDGQVTGTITHGSNDWLIDSGASKQMIGFKESFVILFEHESPHKVKLGDDY